MSLSRKSISFLVLEKVRSITPPDQILHQTALALWVGTIRGNTRVYFLFFWGGEEWFGVHFADFQGQNLLFFVGIKNSKEYFNI